jgi:hypothetical protein
MNRRAWIFLSLCLNLALIATLAWTAAAREFAGRRADGSAPIHRRVIRTLVTTNPVPVVAVEVRAAFDWSQVESEDYRIYAGNLRTIGCPEETVRDIVVADVNELMSRRAREIADDASRRFWELLVNKDELQAIVEQKMKELEGLKKERQELLTWIFNDSAVDTKRQQDERDPPRLAEQRQGLEFLSDEKYAGLYEIKNRFETARRELVQTIAADKAERERKVKELQLQKEQAIAGFLSPEELVEYKLRSGAASQLRSQLGDFDITETEMRAVALASTQPNGQDQIKQLLGERFADFERAQDGAYQETLRFAERLNFPREKAAKVYELRRTVLAHMNSVRNDASRTDQERQEILKAMQAETERSMAQLLGDKAFGILQKNGKEWLWNFPSNAQ